MIYISRFCSIGSIVGVVILGACAFATNDVIGSIAYFLIAILLSIYAHNDMKEAQQPPADRAKVNLMPMAEFQQKYGGQFTVQHTATGETIITTTTPPWWDGVHEMD